MKKEKSTSDKSKKSNDKNKSIEISDADIDIRKVKCWCIFGDKEFQDYVKSLKPAKKKSSSSKKSATVSEGLGLDIAKGTFTFLGKVIAGCAKYLYAKGKYIISNVGKSNRIAYMKFVAKKQKYCMYFDIAENKWTLNYAGANIFSMKSTPSQEEADQLAKTHIAKKFIDSCKKTIEPVISNDKLLKSIIKDVSNGTDKNAYAIAAAMKKILEDKENIMANMFVVKIYVA